jgi:hypothetical protein
MSMVSAMPQILVKREVIPSRRERLKPRRTIFQLFCAERAARPRG